MDGCPRESFTAVLDGFRKTSAVEIGRKRIVISTGRSWSKPSVSGQVPSPDGKVDPWAATQQPLPSFDQDQMAWRNAARLDTHGVANASFCRMWQHYHCHFCVTAVDPHTVKHAPSETIRQVDVQDHQLGLAFPHLFDRLRPRRKRRPSLCTETTHSLKCGSTVGRDIEESQQGTI